MTADSEASSSPYKTDSRHQRISIRLGFEGVVFRIVSGKFGFYLVAVGMVISQRRVDLAQRKMRVRPSDLLRILPLAPFFVAAYLDNVTFQP
jgi:hypothetical protein